MREVLERQYRPRIAPPMSSNHDPTAAPSPPARARGRELVLGATLALLLVVGNAAWVAHARGLMPPPESVPETDHWRYIEMAAGPRHWAHSPLARHSPYGFRVLVPIVVYGLTRVGVEMDLAFYLLTNLSLIAALAALYLILRTLEFDRRLAILGTALAGLLPGMVRWYEYQYWLTDPACLFLMTLTPLLVLRGRERALPLLGAIGVAVRETYLFLVPWYFARALRLHGARVALVRTARFALPQLLVFVAIRVSIPAIKHSPSIVRLVVRFAHIRAADWPAQLYLVTIGSFGVLFPLLLLPRARTAPGRRWPVENLALVGCTYASLLIAGSTDRLLAYAAPAVVPAALRGVQSIAEAGRAWGRC